jgi:dynein heavy chain 2, cytosolic
VSRANPAPFPLLCVYGQVALGSVDIDDFVEKRLVDVGDWKANFKALKSRRKDFERLDDKTRVGCFLVSFVSFKTVVEDHMHRLSDALLVSLRKSALTDLRTLDEFLRTATSRLQTRPRTVEEMTGAKREAKSIGEQKTEMRRVRDRVAAKNDLLREMTAGAIEPLDLSGLKPRWDTFTDLLTVFDDMLNEQKATLVQDIERKIKGQPITRRPDHHVWMCLTPLPLFPLPSPPSSLYRLQTECG